MSVKSVKNNLLHSYVLVDDFEKKISQLYTTISVLDLINAENVINMSREVSKLSNDSLTRIKETVKETEIELPNFFSEFNNESNKIINEYSLFNVELEEIIRILSELYLWFLEIGYEKVTVEYRDLDILLKSKISFLVSFRNKIQIYLMMIDFYDKKLRG